MPNRSSTAAEHGREAGLTRLPMGLISLDFDDLASLFDVADERDFGWVEIYLDVSATELDADWIRSLRAERGIGVVSVASMAKLSQASDDELSAHAALIERSIRMAATIGAPFATFMYGSQPTLGARDARERFIRRVAPLAALAVDSGVTLLIENVFSRGTPGDLDSVEVTLDLFERLDHAEVGLNFDPANFAIAGEEAYPRAYRALRHLIRYMHLKDVRIVAEDDKPLGNRRVLEDHKRGKFLVVPLGDGILDVRRLIREFADDDLGVVVALEPTAKGNERTAWLDASTAFLESCGVTTSGTGAAEVLRGGVSEHRAK